MDPPAKIARDEKDRLNRWKEWIAKDSDENLIEHFAGAIGNSCAKNNWKHLEDIIEICQKRISITQVINANTTHMPPHLHRALIRPNVAKELIALLLKYDADPEIKVLNNCSKRSSLIFYIGENALDIAKRCNQNQEILDLLNKKIIEEKWKK